MSAITFKVDPKITSELDRIKEEEGLGNRTSTFTFLIKHYMLTKQNSLDKSINLLETLVGRIDPNKLPSAEDQLKDI